MKQPPDAQTEKLFWRTGLTGAETLLIDPDRFNTATETYSISYFVPSPDGKFIVYAIVANGSGKTRDPHFGHGNEDQSERND